MLRHRWASRCGVTVSPATDSDVGVLHVGGDRFAGNLVVLHGLYYGFLDPRRAIEVMTAYEAGRVLPEWLRGRAGLPAPVQAAQGFARERLGMLGVDELSPLSFEAMPGTCGRCC